METISALLALCVEFLSQRLVSWSFDAFFYPRLNKQLIKQSWGWWFEAPSWSLWRHCNGARRLKINGLVQHCNISITNAMVVLQYCNEPSKWANSSNKHILFTSDSSVNTTYRSSPLCRHCNDKLQSMRKARGFFGAQTRRCEVLFYLTPTKSAYICRLILLISNMQLKGKSVHDLYEGLYLFIMKMCNAYFVFKKWD